MDLLQKYQKLSSLPLLSNTDLNWIAKILQIAEYDDSLGSKIRELEYRFAKDESRLDDAHIQYYSNQQTKLKDYLEQCK